jgi:hypothetical protein
MIKIFGYSSLATLLQGVFVWEYPRFDARTSIVACDQKIKMNKEVRISKLHLVLRED